MTGTIGDAALGLDILKGGAVAAALAAALVLLALIALGVLVLVLVLGGIVAQNDTISAHASTAADKAQHWMASLGVDKPTSTDAAAIGPAQRCSTCGRSTPARRTRQPDTRPLFARFHTA